MEAKTFSEIHFALMNDNPLVQCEYLKDAVGLLNGLCSIRLNNKRLGENELLKLFEPSDDSWGEYYRSSYWGQMEGDFDELQYNVLRQNIILICAAMNNEL